MSQSGSSVTNFVWWARDTAQPRGLSRAQRMVLMQLASRANRRGCCDPSIEVLATATTYSEGHTKRVLRELEELKLVRSTRRGRARTSLRQLCPDAPLPAAPCPCGTMPLFDAALEPVADVAEQAAPAPVEVSSGASVVSSGETQKYLAEEEQRGDARSAHVPSPESAGEEAPPRVVTNVLQSRLTDVLEIMGAAPGLLIEPLAVNAALAAYPEHAGHDHRCAAHVVASWAFEGGLHNGAANRQLMAALRKQTPLGRSGGDRSVGREHAGRARRAAPAAPVVGGYMRED